MVVKKKPVQKNKKPRQPMAYPSDEMLRWSVLLAQELVSWPQVFVKPMFGMEAFYRGPHIFCAVPKKRAFFTPNGVIFKINGASPAQISRMKTDKRVDIDFGKMQKWYNFDLSSDRDLNGALDWFGEAYEAAGKQPINKTTKTTRKK